ncbi:MAG: hypothetical protein IJF87_05655 [Erysipelotrichaceae bacterium]|nr:hypothetical protein [Erysipelotrichaceae bacterium]MBQ3412463.1 hypothetical protein [Oscillospiraceae bacterium]
MEEKNDNQLNSITVCEDSDSSSENEATVENKRWKKRGTKALMGLVALVASASVALAGFFSEPAALLDRDIKIPSPQVDVMVDDDDDEGDENQQNEEETSFREKAKSFILRIPWAIRSTVGVAMWSLGWVILKVLSVLWLGVLSPIVSFLLKCLLTFVLFAVLIAGVLKLLFPWLKLSDIFNKRNIIFLIIVSVLVNLCDLVLPHFWDNYRNVRNIVVFSVYVLVTLIIVVAVTIQVRKWKRDGFLGLKARARENA